MHWRAEPTTGRIIEASSDGSCYSSSGYLATYASAAATHSALDAKLFFMCRSSFNYIKTTIINHPIGASTGPYRARATNICLPKCKLLGAHGQIRSAAPGPM